MLLTDFPEEILIMIIRDLDLFTLESLFYVCKRLRNIVCLHGVVKKGHMSRNVTATANKLKTEFFKAIAYNLLELNMSGVPDLCKTALLPALKKLKNLKILDISYTNLHMLDMPEIYKICPTLKDITVNFKCCGCVKVPKNIMMQCQSVFQHFENIHFVGSVIYLLHSKRAFYLVAKANLHSLKYTITDKDCLTDFTDAEYDDYVKLPNFNQFTIYILNWYHRQPPFLSMSLDDFPILSMLELEKSEYIIIYTSEFKPKVYASPLFRDFFKEYFNVTILYLSEFEVNLFENIVVKVWNKDATNFDEYFYNTLLKQVKQYIPYHFIINNESNVLVDPAMCDWFYNMPLPNACQKYTNLRETNGLTRKRQAVPNFVLNYDEIFKDKHLVELNLEFKYPTNFTISLNANCNYLGKLTYLSIVGLGRFSSDFFNVLFHCCHNLVTLNLHTLPMASPILSISHSLLISKSLKNVRLVHKHIDMKTLFSSFSQCRNLENIHIVDESFLECNDLANPSAVVEKCDNLYSIYIEAKITDSTKTKTIRLFNKAKALYNKHHINVMIKNLDQLHPRNYDPFIDVFRVSPIRPL